jgi:hypothetical protein
MALAGCKEGIVTKQEPYTVESDPIETPAWPTIPTWRYLGAREAADAAYCARFGTTEAPEPTLVPGGIWAYALPPAATAVKSTTVR